MMRTLSLFLFCLFASACFVNGQDIDRNRWSPIAYVVESGIMARSTDNIVDRPNMRRTSGDEYCLHLGRVAHLRQYYLDFKPEFGLNQNLSICAGIRYTNCIGEMRKHDSFPVWCVETDGTNSYWMSARFISQNARYLGVPLELRYTVDELYSASFLLKAGLSLNFLVSNKNSVELLHGSSSKYARIIERYIGEPDKVTLPMWLSIGCQIGSDGNVTLELKLPVNMSMNNTFSMCNVDSFGIGFSVGYRINTY